MSFASLNRNIVLVLIVYLQMAHVYGYARSQQRPRNLHSQWSIQHITVDNGLSNNFVNRIVADRNGYLWFATVHGLNKYNGISIKKYFYDRKTPNSLLSNNISTLYLDSDSTLWIGTSSGLQYYDDKKDNFVHVPIPDGHATREIFSIAEDAHKHLLIGSSSGMFSYNMHNKQVRLIDLRKYGVKYDSIYRIIIDRDNNIWFTSYQKGLYYFDRKSRSIQHFTRQRNNPESLSDNWIFHLYIDRKNQLWVGTYNSGICKFNPSDSSFSRYLIDPQYEFTKRIRTIFEDRHGRLFFGSREGLFLFDEAREEFTLYALDTHEISKLSQNSVTCSFTDNKGILWLGTHSGGVNQIDMYQKEFVKFPSIPKNTSFLNNGAVYCFAETGPKLYIGTEKGLNILDKPSNTFTLLRNIPGNPHSISYDDIKDIAIENDNRIWLATNRGGLNLLNKSNKVIACYRHDPKSPHSLPSDNLYSVFIDRDKELWVISNADWDRANAVLSRFDKKTQTFKHYHKRFFMCIQQANDSTLLFGGIYGFYYFNKHTEQFVAIENDSLIYRTQTLYEDKEHNIWIGSSLGLTKYDRQQKNFVDISSVIGTPIEEVYGILNYENNLWISTNNGLLEIQDIYKKGKLTYRYFDKNDGLQSREFNYNAYIKTSDNRYYFGSDNGFNYFYPEKIKNNPYPPEIHFSSILVSGKEIKPGNTDAPVMPQTLDYTDEITLKYNSGSITLSFDALHFSKSKANAFKYKLEGLDKDWNYANAYNNFVTYHKLSPKKYKFIVYAISSDGIESETPAQLKINILPPYWETTGFKITILAIIVLLIGLIIHLRTIYLQKQKELLQRSIREKTKELESSNKTLKEGQELILNQNEEIRAQRDIIHEKNKLLEHLYNRAIQLNEFGAELTASLNIASINRKIFDHTKSMVNLTLFGIGIYKNDHIAFDYLFEDGKEQEPVCIDIDKKDSCVVHCFQNNKTIVIDSTQSNNKYPCEPLTTSAAKIKSTILLPLHVKQRKVGVLALQSTTENAYSNPHDMTLIQSIATFIAIAIDNSNAYRLIEQQNIDLEQHRLHLEDMVNERTRELEKEKIKAEESDKLKSAFLANMSHEIRTPLNAIIGFINILSEDEDVGTNKYFEIIKKSGYSLLNLIEDIIDFSRIESGVIDISPSKINLMALLDNTLKEFKEAVAKNNKDLGQQVNIALENKINPGNPFLTTDLQRLNQIISNLLTNAIKFTHQGDIIFGIENIENTLYTFYVKDTGIGIDSVDLDYIFKRFRKLEHKTEKLYRGGGLGLSISKNLAELLGGSIWVESEVGKGSTFFFSINDISESQSSITSQNQENKPIEVPDWSRKTVLIVEDEKSNYELIESILKKTNISTLYATNGKEGIISFMKNKDTIDIVLMDLQLPILSGYETSKFIKRIKSDVPIIAQSAYATTEDKKEIQQSVMEDYISKPISSNLLLLKMKQYLPE